VAPAVSGAPKVNDDELDAATAAIVARLEQAGNDREEQLRLETWLWLDGPASIEGRVSGAPRELALEMNRQVKATGTSEKGGASDVRAWSRLEEIDAPATVVSCALDVTSLRRAQPRNRRAHSRGQISESARCRSPAQPGATRPVRGADRRCPQSFSLMEAELGDSFAWFLIGIEGWLHPDGVPRRDRELAA